MPSSVTYGEIVEEVARRTGLATDADAEEAIEATVMVLAGCLPRPDALALAAELPDPVGGFFRAATYRCDLVPEDFYAAVAAREGIGLGHAAEHAMVVCQELSAALPPLERHRFPPSLAPLFEVHPPSHAMPPRHRGRSLAGGRPGSDRPLSESQPTAGQSHSVARSANPHADTKLSSAGGTAQERDGRTIATGRGGSKSPLSGR